MGLFAINMPLLYGEREREFIRLQEEIIKVIDDDSIFAWRCSCDSEGILASSPAGFLHSSHIVNDPALGSFPSNPPIASSKGIHIEARFIRINTIGYGIVIFDCKEEGGFAPLAIVVKDIFLNMANFKRVASNLLVTVHMGTFATRLYPIRRICIQKAQQAATRTQRKSPLHSAATTSTWIYLNTKSANFPLPVAAIAQEKTH